MIEYVVVNVDSHKKLGVSSENLFKPYKGLDRSPWLRVDDMYYAKELPEDIALIRTSSFSNHVGNFSPGSVKSFADASKLLAVCDPGNNECEVIGIELLGVISLIHQMQRSRSNSLGIDCYVDGYGSLLALGVFEKPEIFREFHKLLNRNGLFADIESLRTYVAAYFDVAKSADLEPIERSKKCLFTESRLLEVAFEIYSSTRKISQGQNRQ